MRPDTVLLATRNEGKLRELRPLFARSGLSVVSLSDVGIAERAEEDDLECHASFAENALAKARYFHALSGGRPTVADDSGLAVDALAGAPGVRSKRWSGSTATGRALDHANNAALQRALEGVESRRASFVCAAAYVADDGEIVRLGETTGEILHEPEGNEGFGYDPYFRSVDLGVTFGSATTRMKEQVSHRGRAFASLLAELERSWHGGVR